MYEKNNLIRKERTKNKNILPKIVDNMKVKIKGNNN